MMTQIESTHSVARTERYVTATVDDEIVMMSIEKGTYFGLDGIGTHIWHALEQPKPVLELCFGLQTAYDVHAEQCEQDVLAFLNELAREGMIKIVT